MSAVLFVWTGDGSLRIHCFYQHWQTHTLVVCFLFLTFPVLRDEFVRQESHVCYSILLLQYGNWNVTECLTITTRGLSIGNQVYEASQMWLFLLISGWMISFGYCIVVNGPKETVYSTCSTLWSCQNVESCMPCTNRSNFHHPVLMHILDYRIWKAWWKYQNWGGKYYLIFFFYYFFFFKYFMLARGGNTIAE